MHPFRYGLLDEFSGDTDEWWGSCVDIDGLFVDLPRPGPVRVRLLGCEPAGVLREALQSAVPVRIGDVHLEDARPATLSGWRLRDVTVLGRVPGVADVELEGLCDIHEPPGAHGFLLAGESGSLGSCAGIEGLSAEREQPARPMRFIGLEPQGALRDKLAKGTTGHVGPATIVPRDRHGNQSRPQWHMSVTVVTARPSSVGEGLVDLVVANGVHEPPPRVARSIWDMWFAGGPAEKNLWAGHDAEGRRAWLAAALAQPRTEPEAEPGQTFHVDGRFVTDELGFYCALGEAVNGPGGYFGWNWPAVRDCLRGGFGTTAPFTLVWHDADVARKYLRLEAERASSRRDPFTEWVELIREFATLDLA